VALELPASVTTMGRMVLTHAKSILISPPDVAIEHLFPPYTPEKVQALNQWFAY